MSFVKHLTFYLMIKTALVLALISGNISETNLVWIANPATSLILMLMFVRQNGFNQTSFWLLCFDIILPILAPLFVLNFILYWAIQRKIKKLKTAKKDDKAEESLEKQMKENKYNKALLHDAKQYVDSAIYDLTKNAEPYMDILYMGSNQLKKGVIAKLANQHDAHSIELLRLAQNDNAYEIQFLATTAIQKIEDAFNEKLSVIEKQIEKDPSNPRLLEQQGDIYSDFNKLGILDEGSNQGLLEKALFAYLIAMQSDARNPYLAKKLCHLYEVMQNYTAAVDLATTALDLLSDRVEENSIEINEDLQSTVTSLLLIRAKSHFRIGKFSEVINDLREVGAAEIEDRDLNEIREYWQSIDQRLYGQSHGVEQATL